MRVQLDPEDDPSVWNQDDADWLVGKYALIGITHVAADGETVTGQDQYHGRIESADSEGFRAVFFQTTPVDDAYYDQIRDICEKTNATQCQA